MKFGIDLSLFCDMSFVYVVDMLVVYVVDMLMDFTIFIVVMNVV